MSIGTGMPPSAPRPSNENDKASSARRHMWGPFGEKLTDDEFSQKLLAMKPFVGNPEDIGSKASPDTTEESHVAPLSEREALASAYVSEAGVVIGHVVRTLMENEADTTRQAMTEAISDMARTAYFMGWAARGRTGNVDTTDNQGIGE